MDESGQSDRTHRIIEQALSDADFGKNDGGYDNGRPARNIEWFIAALRERGYDICEASAAPPEPPHDCVAIEAELERAVAERDAIAAEIRVLDAEAAASQPPPLDVERLARAALNVERLARAWEQAGYGEVTGDIVSSEAHKAEQAAAPEPPAPSVERYDAQTVGLIAACHEKDIYSRLDLLVALAASLHEEPEGTTRPVDSE